MQDPPLLLNEFFQEAVIQSLYAVQGSIQRPSKLLYWSNSSSPLLAPPIAAPNITSSKTNGVLSGEPHTQLVCIHTDHFKESGESADSTRAS